MYLIACGVELCLPLPPDACKCLPLPIQYPEDLSYYSIVHQYIILDGLAHFGCSYKHSGLS